MSNSNNREDELYHKEVMMIILLRVFVSVCLLISGIVILALRIPGWGIILGLPLVIFGSVFIIYTYDEVLSRQIVKHIHQDPSHKSSEGGDVDEDGN